MVASVSALISPAHPLLMNASRFILLKMYFLPASSASCTNGLGPNDSAVPSQSTVPSSSEKVIWRAAGFSSSSELMWAPSTIKRCRVGPAASPGPRASPLDRPTTGFALRHLKPDIADLAAKGCDGVSFT